MSKEKDIKVIVDKSSEIRKTWEEWARKGNWRVRGYKIIEAPSGPETKDKNRLMRYMLIDRPHGELYQHSLGLVSKFFIGIIEGKLFGTRCPKCNTCYCPPRVHCWNPECKLAECNWEELPLKGRVHTFSVMLFSADAFLEHLPFVLGYIQIDNADTAIPMQILTAPDQVFIGQRVEIKFRENRMGELMDMYALPEPGQEIPEDSCLHRPKYLEDLNKNLEKTYQFLEKRFGYTKEDIQKRWQR